MATLSAAKAQHATLVAATVDTVTLTEPFAYVEVANVDGAAIIYFTVNGATPASEADDTFVVPATVGASRKVFVNATSPVVKVISAGTPKYAVTGLHT